MSKAPTKQKKTLAANCGKCGSKSLSRATQKVVIQNIGRPTSVGKLFYKVNLCLRVTTVGHHNAFREWNPRGKIAYTAFVLCSAGALGVTRYHFPNKWALSQNIRELEKRYGLDIAHIKEYGQPMRYVIFSDVQKAELKPC